MAAPVVGQRGEFAYAKAAVGAQLAQVDGELAHPFTSLVQDREAAAGLHSGRRAQRYRCNRQRRWRGLAGAGPRWVFRPDGSGPCVVAGLLSSWMVVVRARNAGRFR
jgi:hypothetical protein